jgi:hypothetical protein
LGKNAEEKEIGAPLRPFKASFKVLGKGWRLQVITPQQYEARFDKQSVGITLSTKKEIYLPADHVTLEVILHEIAHAFFDEVCAHAADLEGEQMEEIACDLIAKHATEMLKIASRIYKRAK